MILEKNPKYPDIERHGICVSPDLQDLINKLLNKDMELWLGTKGDVDEVMKHPFFKGIEVDKLLWKEYKPDFVP